MRLAQPLGCRVAVRLQAGRLSVAWAGELAECRRPAEMRRLAEMLQLVPPRIPAEPERNTDFRQTGSMVVVAWTMMLRNRGQVELAFAVERHKYWPVQWTNSCWEPC